MTWLRFSCFVFAASALAGCDGSASHDGSPVAEAASWRLEMPAARIGEAPGQELDRVYGGLLRPDGTLVIGNSGTAELRFFDGRGQLRHAVGRKGAGPGEFGSINWIAELPGDSLIAFDMRHRRFSVWDSAGRFARTFSVPFPGPVRPVGVFGDGSLMVAVEGQYDPRGGAGVVRDSMRVARIDRTGQVVGQLGSFPGAEWLLYEHPTSFRAAQLPFGRTGHLALVGEEFVYGSSESGRLTVHDGSGRQVRTIDVPGSGRGISRDEISATLSEIEDPAERSALTRHYRRGVENGPPVVTALRGDRDGNLWARLPAAAGADSVTWLVLSPRGERLGSVRMHATALPLDDGDGKLMLREANADGVQTVSVRAVRR